MFPKEICPVDFASRRSAFLRRIKDSVALFPAAPERIRNGDVAYPYRQDSNFYYLTGFDEPQSICLLAPHLEERFHLYVRPRDKEHERWEGRLAGVEGARKSYGAEAAFPSTPPDRFEANFIAALADAKALYYRVGIDTECDQRVFGLLYRAARRHGRSGGGLWPILDPNEILAEMRVVKSRDEIARLRAAGHISAEAHVNAMRIAKPGMFEYELEAVLHHAIRARGAGRTGYGSIVASGPNACVLHYRANNRRLEPGDLVLVDAAAEYDYYTADVTRVFPATGSFTKEQRDVYNVVLEAQKECINAVRPGRSLRDIHDVATEVLTEGLRRLKILRGGTRAIVKAGKYRKFFPHSAGHFLGMDVHDVGRSPAPDYDSPRKLEPGMVCAIEPGLYFPPEAGVPARFRGIGVRIEDDVLVTAGGSEVLTSAVPKEREEIETLCSQS